METIEIYGKEYKVYDFDKIKGTCYGFIYVTVNNITGKMYLGLHSRWQKNYLGSGNYLLNAIRKYGRETFTRYIIDTADDYEELIHLEAEYIREKFNIDLATSDDWYNITSGLQRGGDTWAGMTEEDRELRSNRISEANTGRVRTPEQIKLMSKITSERMADPKNRKKISEATRKAMARPEVKAKLQKPRGTINYSEEELERRRKAMTEVGKSNIGKEPWNKGKEMDEDTKDRILNTMMPEVTAYIEDKVIIDKEKIPNSYQGVADRIEEITGVKIGKNKVRDLINKKEEFVPKVSRHEDLRGLRINSVTYLDNLEGVEKDS